MRLRIKGPASGFLSRRVYCLCFPAILILFLFVSCKGKDESASQDEVAAVDSNTRFAKNYFSDCAKMKAEALVYDSILMTQLEVEPVSANNAIKVFTDYAYYCRHDSLSPIFLIKTAQVARAVNNIPQAQLVLERCIDAYPQFRDRPAAIFLLAQLYDDVTHLNNELEARRYYQQIIDEYPKSVWADNAKAAMAMSGKSDIQIMNELKNK